MAILQVDTSKWVRWTENRFNLSRIMSKEEPCKNLRMTRKWYILQNVRNHIFSRQTLNRKLHYLTANILLGWSALSYEPPHDNANKVAYAPSEDSDQPGHPPSLIRVFAVRLKHHWVLSYPIKRTAKTLIRLDGLPVWSKSSLGAHVICWFCHEAAHI